MVAVVANETSVSFAGANQPKGLVHTGEPVSKSGSQLHISSLYIASLVLSPHNSEQLRTHLREPAEQKHTV